MAETTRIEGGIEFYSVPNVAGDYDEGQQCARCGSSADWVDCYNCGGEGELGSDCIDDLCHGGECIHGDSGQLRCDICRGKGGWWRCISSRDWCTAHPMSGREAIGFHVAMLLVVLIGNLVPAQSTTGER